MAQDKHPSLEKGTESGEIDVSRGITDDTKVTGREMEETADGGLRKAYKLVMQEMMARGGHTQMENGTKGGGENMGGRVWTKP